MGARRCALTFDDGPDPVWTPAVLESLEEHRLRATFFVIGSRARSHPDLIARMLATGHEGSASNPSIACQGPGAAAQLRAVQGAVLPDPVGRWNVIS